METLIATCIALLAPLPALRRVPVEMLPPLWYAAGALFIAWGLHVLVPVSGLLGLVFCYCCLAPASSFSADTKNPQP